MMRDPLLKATPSLSVNIPTYNMQHFAAPSLDCLRSLGESPRLDRERAIVVDEGSTDETEAVLDKVET
jgi:glycosyltransferase involved in cell wall biosynthesis